MTTADAVYLHGIFTAAALAFVAALFTGLFVVNRMARRDRLNVIAILLSVANLAGTFYLLGMAAVRLGYHLEDLSWVRPAYIVIFLAAPVLAGFYLAVHAMLIQRWPPDRWLRVLLYGAAPLAVLTVFIPGRAGVIGSGEAWIEDGIVRMDFGWLAPLYFGLLTALIVAMAVQVAIALTSREEFGRGVWWFHGASFLAISLTPVADMLREFGVALVPAPVSWVGFGFFALSAFALLTVQYALALEHLEEGRRTVRELNEALSRDRLTGLYSRVALEQMLERRLSEGDTRGGLLFVDLDDFKVVNDRYGHQHGDRVLRDVGAAIREAVREDDCAARWGGDEFIILLSSGDQPQAEQVGTRLLEELRRVGETHTTAPVGASIGFVPLNAYETAEALIGAADAALYRAKGAGKGKCEMNSEMGAS